jgi:YHS domain-containing protein
MKSRILLAALACSAIVLSQALVAADKSDYQAKCPVSGKPAKETSTADFQGGKVQFCCDNCPNAFKADTKKYAAKAALQMLGTGQLKQVACPLSGKACNPEAAVALDGVSVAFCCNNCKGKVEKADDKVIAALGGDLAKGFTAQTKCPVSGKPIDPAQTVEYKGAKVYFCCDGCPAAFEKDPSKYTAKLPQLSK